jgi:predicted lipoprotein
MVQSKFSRLKMAGLCAGVLLPLGGLHAAPVWPELNRLVVDRHIVPRYTQLVQATAALEERSAMFCASADTAGLNQVRDGYQSAMDAWASVQHIRFGPVTAQQRYERFEYWPDKHNTGERQLSKALAEQDLAQLSADRFSAVSIALQGLGTLERLLYGDDVQPEQFAGRDRPSYQCRLIEAVAHNLAIMSREVADEWTKPGSPYRDSVLGAEQGNAYFASSREVSAGLLNDLYTSLQVIVDQKLLPVMGHGPEEIGPKRAESWRSGRSLRNIQLNLEADQELYAIEFSPMLVADGSNAARVQEDAAIRRDFKTALAGIRGIERPLDEVVQDTVQRPALEQLLATVSDLKRHISGPIPVALDLPRAFNGLDGD